MKYDAARHHRRSIRLKGYDYAQAGAYFVTICVQGRECVLGKVVDGQMRLNDWGRVAEECWMWLGDQYPYVVLDTWAVMPNHLHGIIVLDDRKGDSRIALTRIALTTDKRKPLGRLVGVFKTVSTKRINEMRGTPGAVFWQRNYWEHVIRNDADLARIRAYIQNNPARWTGDQLHPDAPSNKYNRG